MHSTTDEARPVLPANLVADFRAGLRSRDGAHHCPCPTRATQSRGGGRAEERLGPDCSREHREYRPSYGYVKGPARAARVPIGVGLDGRAWRGGEHQLPRARKAVQGMEAGDDGGSRPLESGRARETGQYVSKESSSTWRPYLVKALVETGSNRRGSATFLRRLRPAVHFILFTEGEQFANAKEAAGAGRAGGGCATSTSGSARRWSSAVASSRRWRGLATVTTRSVGAACLLHGIGVASPGADCSGWLTGCGHRAIVGSEGHDEVTRTMLDGQASYGAKVRRTCEGGEGASQGGTGE